MHYRLNTFTSRLSPKHLKSSECNRINQEVHRYFVCFPHAKPTFYEAEPYVFHTRAIWFCIESPKIEQVVLLIIPLSLLDYKNDSP